MLEDQVSAFIQYIRDIQLIFVCVVFRCFVFSWQALQRQCIDVLNN